ncbi:MAG: hypothetical protein QOK82_00595 [Nitrososphaeraceae archaeon]|nr:hypothetical protein [Nitrososphaeraceae archaeon]
MSRTGIRRSKRSGLLKPKADLPDFDRLSNDTYMKVISKEIIVAVNTNKNRFGFLNLEVLVAMQCFSDIINQAQ